MEPRASTSKCAKKPCGPQLGGESLSALVDFFLRKGIPANTYGRECVLPPIDNLKKVLVS